MESELVVMQHTTLNCSLMTDVMALDGNTSSLSRAVFEASRAKCTTKPVSVIVI